MSVRTMARVWDQSGHAGTELLMLLAIADFADDEGNAYPAVQTLAAKCRMSSRNANFILSALRQTGELEVRANEGPKGTNRYKVVTGLKPTSPLKPASPLKPTSSTPEAGFLKPLKPTSDEPSLNHQEPPIGRVRTPNSSACPPPPVEELILEQPKSKRQPTNEDTPAPAKAKRARKVSDAKTFSEWYAERKATGGKILEPDDPSRAYVKTLGLNGDFLEVAWSIFRDDHLISEKKQKSWPQTFLVYLRKGYLRPWFHKDGVWRLTTAGKQAAILIEHDPDMQCGHDDDWTRDVMRGVI